MSALRGSGATVRARVREDGEVIAIEHEGLLRVVQNDAELSELFMRAFILRRVGLIQAQQGDVVLIGSQPLGRDAPPAAVPRPQRLPVREPRRRSRPRRRRAARALPGGDRRGAGRHLPRRGGPQEPDERAARRVPPDESGVRPRDGPRSDRHRRGAGGARGRRLRRLRGARRARARDDRAGRAGGDELEDRELPRLPDRHLGAGARRARARPGAEVRGRRGGRRHRRAPAVPPPSVPDRARERACRARADDRRRDRRRIPADRHREPVAVRGRGRLLRGDLPRSADLPRARRRSSSAAETRPARRRSSSRAAAGTCTCSSGRRAWRRRCRAT